MAVRAHGLLSRRMALVVLALFVGQSGSTVLLARSGAEGRTPKKASVEPASGRMVGANRPGRRLQGREAEEEEINARPADGANPWAGVNRAPRELRMRRARSWDGDLRSLPYKKVRRRERPEREGPRPAPRLAPAPEAGTTGLDTQTPTNLVPTLSAPAPAPLASFDGLDYATWGAGHPPDTVGDVGPDHYIQSINSSVGIYRKTDGVRLAAFTLDTLMSQGNFGNNCDNENFGDPVVLYDTFEDRWVITDFAFKLSPTNDVIPPAMQCFAVSKTGDPVAGGWNFFSIEALGGLGDYPKLGIWPDGIYMSANMFGYANGAAYQGPRLWAFNKAQLYAGAATVQVVTFDGPAADFTILPSNARLQAGTPPAGAPNYFLSSGNFLNAVSIYKFHVDWSSIALSSFTGPDVPISATSWPNATVPNAPAQGGTALDVLSFRAMMQNQYTNIGGAESLWAAHTVRRANTTGFAAPRWYQVNVTGGTVAATIPQAATWDPDAANVLHRFIPSLAVNRNGDMAIGYSTSSSTTKPGLRYAGRLAADPVNTFSQTEQLLVQGTGTQVGTSRWGDYSAMTLDPDGCTFWFTSEYYKVDGLDHQTRIGSFQFPGCTPVGEGTLSGTVRDAGTSAPLAGATVAVGSRTATTDGSGVYSFTLPAGTYPSATASFPGLASSTQSAVVIVDGAVTTQDFALASAATSGCFTDTTQADFLAGVQAGVDLTTTPGDVLLSKAVSIDQNTTLGTQGAGATLTTWLGQTFTPAQSGPVARIDLNLFSLNCGAVAMPSLTISIRSAAANLPTGADLATATMPGFCNGAGANFTATFATPATVTAGTQYAIVMRPATAIPVVVPAAGYFWTVSAGTGAVAVQNPYAGGRRASSANSGGTWTGAAGNANNDHGFKIYIDQGYGTSGTQVSSVKDANPVGGAIPSWGVLSWVSSIPANTAVTFQAAASESATGPFAFVGPDGTAASSFSSGASLTQFDGKRYLKYRATLGSTLTTATPTLSSVSTCFEDVPATTTLVVEPASGVFGGTADLSATLRVGGTPLAGKTVAFTLAGNAAGSGTTDSTGLATVSAASIAAFTGGLHAGAVGASFAGDTGYGPSSGSADLTVTKAPATVTLTAASLSAVYDGSPHAAAATTSPAGLTVDFTYDGGSAAPTNAGSYAVVATVNDVSYAGTATGTLVIDKAAATVTLTAASLSAVYDGSPHAAAATTSPAGLTVDFTYDGGSAAPTNVGSYAVVATVNDANYSGTATGTLVIDKAAATVTLTAASLSAVYDGSPHAAAATTSPAGLTVDFTYDGGSAAPTNVGSYAVVATVNDANYSGTATGTLVIDKATATVTLTPASLSAVYDTLTHAAAATTVPAGLTVTFTYAGSPTPPSGAGSYAVVATVVDATYSGSATGTLVIDKAAASVTLSGLSAGFDGTPKSATVTTVPAGLAVQVTYDGSLTAPSAVGSYAVLATVVDANYAGTGAGTLNIAEASATLSGLTARVPYDGTPKSAPIVTVPAGLSLSVTYDGSATPPTMPGTYAVVATITDPGYTGGGTGTLTVATTVAVRHAPSLLGRVDGSLTMLLPEKMVVGAAAALATDILVPGTPTVRVAPRATYGGTLDGDGSAVPSTYLVAINGRAKVRNVVRRVDALAFPTLTLPPLSTGTRNVVLTSAMTNAGNFATIRNLSLRGATGLIAVPPGTYGTFTTGAGGGFILGVPGAIVPSVYNFKALTLNGASDLQIVGPVILNVRGNASLSGTIGDPAHPDWLQVQLAAGSLMVKAATTVNGFVIAPAGTVTVSVTSSLRGGVISDRFVLPPLASIEDE